MRLSDAFTTGSSIMPQKRNPDAAELVRAKSGRVIGALVSLLIVMKGLPLAYRKDMQEDKAPVFDGSDTLELCLAATTGMVGDLEADPGAMRRAAERGFAPRPIWPTGWSAARPAVPPGASRHRPIVRLAEERGCGLAELDLASLQAIEPGITAELFTVLGVEAAVASRHSYGGTAPARVLEQVAAARERCR